MADNELGAFLRAKREAATPEAAGLPAGPRRRTPGLRRAELATLAGVSVEYLTRLEQGRDRRPSGEILAALADALRLPADERIHLHRLVKAVTGGACAAAAQPPGRTVRPTVRAVLDRLDPAPALVVNTLTDVLAFTSGFEKLALPIGLLEPEVPNLARYVFTDPRARTAFPDWDAMADARASELRAAAALGDHHAALLADELAGAEFSRRYDSPGALPARTGVERWGTLTLAYESLELPDSEEQRLIVYLEG
ncbi:helix-turn-helix domain-containing protein [Nonomuraea sp. NPDC050556]|uniref:helix-turn-helix domain-containing protein n=1 Tax=Nonomuraea sp. NPDC050556 TaxID=3364369 RepID=UPI0037AFB4A2